MKLGNTHTLVTAYSALATVALGLIAFDAIDRRHPQPQKSVAIAGSKSDSALKGMLTSLARQIDTRATSLAAAK